jgi:4-amino-4-deoxy-L-arabinose transferase-like glycosyltransferase
MSSIRPQIERLRDPCALLVALGCALVAQYLFTGEVLTRFRDSQTWAWRPEFTVATALLVGAVLAASRVGRWPVAGAGGTAPRLGWPELATLAPSILLYALGLGVYLRSGETALVDAVWGAAIVGFLVPLAARSWRGRPRTGRPVGRAIWLQWGAIGLLTALAFGLRYWNLEEIPSHVDEDVALMGVHAFDLLERGDHRWIGASTSSHLLAYDQLLAWSMRLFGADHAGLVMHSVLLGTLTVPLLYLLGRSMFGSRVGLIAATLLCVSYTHIHFSRILFGATPTFVLTLVVLLLYRGLRSRDPLWFGLAGVLSGLNFALYDSARVIPIVCLATFLWALVVTPAAVRRDALGWGALAAGAVIAFGPMLAFAIQNFRLFVGRGNNIALWSPGVWAHQQQGYGTDSPVVIIAQQFAHTFLTLHLYGDGSPHFAFPRPMVAATTAALFVLGLGGALRRLGDARHVLLLAWIGLTFVLGGVLTYDPPYWPHLNVVLPAVALIAALGLDRLIDVLAPASGTPRRAALTALAGLTLAFTGLTDWRAYYDFVIDNAGPRIRVARFVDDLPDQYRVYLISEILHGQEHPFRFFSRGVRITDVRLRDLDATARAERGPAVFVVVGQESALSTLTRLYPRAKVEAHGDEAATRPVFVSVTLDG